MKMDSLGILEKDIEENFIRSSGKGGQHVNKVSTCVQLRHVPSGIEVKCGQERSQSLNRYRARVLLTEKFDRMVRGKESEEARRIARIRRKKRKRSRKAQEKVLEKKRMDSEKKGLRAPVRDYEER